MIDGLLALVHPDERPLVRAVFSPSDTRETFTLQFRVLWLDGTPHWIEVHGRKAARPGAAAQVTGTAQEITRRKELDAQAAHSAKMDAIGQLAGGLAHDFNNLLTAILGFARLIADQLHPGDPRASDVAEILKAGQRAAELTRQLLAFSRRQTLRPVLIDLNDLVSGFDSFVSGLVGAAIATEWQLAPALEPIRADRSQVEQVFLNVAANARDAMDRGGRLLIATRGVVLDRAGAERLGLPPGAFVVLSIADSGPGMPADVASRIFEPFFSSKERGTGTGLGLATVFGIVRQSGGAIDVESAPGHGTRFDVYFPAAGGTADADR
jgi:signal transduction histidine kinase